jgi:hypothetical protein
MAGSLTAWPLEQLASSQSDSAGTEELASVVSEEDVLDLWTWLTFAGSSDDAAFLAVVACGSARDAGRTLSYSELHARSAALATALLQLHSPPSALAPVDILQRASSAGKRLQVVAWVGQSQISDTCDAPQAACVSGFFAGTGGGHVGGMHC